MGLTGEQLDLAGGETDVVVERGRQGGAERHGRGEAVGDRAGLGAAWNAVPAQDLGDLPVGVQVGEQLRGGWFRAGRAGAGAAAAAHRDATVVQGPQDQVLRGAQVRGDLGGGPLLIGVELPELVGVESGAVGAGGPWPYGDMPASCSQARAVGVPVRYRLEICATGNAWSRYRARSSSGLGAAVGGVGWGGGTGGRVTPS